MDLKNPKTVGISGNGMGSKGSRNTDLPKVTPNNINSKSFPKKAKTISPMAKTKVTTIGGLNMGK